ncbi:hypothetical protein DENIS_4445 [Desulfonema ishimotonii]|uniref:Uncharacterized protein n=1 Tax=Desulfonema ishimotonii TaxID=45657 RepID=A0A401G2Q0_9BACT|nr:hypothetical protein DENIS_4445 [Desulfonema ishimotonii]
MNLPEDQAEAVRVFHGGGHPALADAVVFGILPVGYLKFVTPESLPVSGDLSGFCVPDFGGPVMVENIAHDFRSHEIGSVAFASDVSVEGVRNQGTGEPDVFQHITGRMHGSGVGPGDGFLSARTGRGGIFRIF